MFRFRIGNIEVTAIEELSMPAAEPWFLFPGLPPDAIERNRQWLAPDFYDPQSGKLVLANRGWLLRTPRSNILIEACNGNDKERPTFARGHRRSTPWLERLQQAGCAPESIDYVLCSHLHVDHVGWFTRLVDGRWLPTFPNARYLIDRVEFADWNPATRTLPPLAINANSWEDSVAPVMAAGLMRLIDAGRQIEEGVRIVPARGHTLGHVAIRVESDGQSALFIGDALHSPLQIVYPDVPTYACEDKAAAVATHHAVLQECVEHGRLLVPTHFPEPFAALCIHARQGRHFFTDLLGRAPPGLE